MFKQLDNARVETVCLTLDGEKLEVPGNIPVAAAMLLTGNNTLRTTPVSSSPRAPFCMMGVCFDCLMDIDGKPNQRACMVTVREGMQLKRQQGAAALTPSAQGGRSID